MEKNVNAINKIIEELSHRDYLSSWNRLTEAQKNSVKFGKRRFCYVLGADTLEAIKTKQNYLFGSITEAEYKSFCLRYNLVTAK